MPIAVLAGSWALIYTKPHNGGVLSLAGPPSTFQHPLVLNPQKYHGRHVARGVFYLEVGLYVQSTDLRQGLASLPPPTSHRPGCLTRAL